VKNRYRFKIKERIKYYIISLLVSLLLISYLYFSTDKHDIGLLVTSLIILVLILGNLTYYTRFERNRDALEIKFRLLKYILFSFIILFISLVVSST